MLSVPEALSVNRYSPGKLKTSPGARSSDFKHKEIYWGPGVEGTLAVALVGIWWSRFDPGTRVASKLVIFHIPDGSRW